MSARREKVTVYISALVAESFFGSLKNEWYHTWGGAGLFLDVYVDGTVARRPEPTAYDDMPL